MNDVKFIGGSRNNTTNKIDYNKVGDVILSFQELPFIKELYSLDKKNNVATFIIKTK